jgi:hypothetical protein
MYRYILLCICISYFEAWKEITERSIIGWVNLGNLKTPFQLKGLNIYFEILILKISNKN